MSTDGIDYLPTEYAATDIKAKWRDDALCDALIKEQEYLVNAWIDEKSEFRGYAREACAACPVKVTCLTSGMNDSESYGLRGGVFFSGGALTHQDNNILKRTLGITARKRQKTREYRISKELGEVV